MQRCGAQPYTLLHRLTCTPICRWLLSEQVLQSVQSCDSTIVFTAERNVLVWLMHGNACILIAGDISVERLANPPVIIPAGAFWEGLEEYWSDLVNELPDIPNGGNHYFTKTLKPSLGQCPASE